MRQHLWAREEGKGYSKKSMEGKGRRGAGCMARKNSLKVLIVRLLECYWQSGGAAGNKERYPATIVNYKKQKKNKRGEIYVKKLLTEC